MSMEQGLFIALNAGTVSVPTMLLHWYARLGLSEADMMLLIHLFSFKEKEQNDFPTIEEIQSRMNAKPERVIDSIQKLMNDGWITIDEEIDPDTGIQYESYNVTGVYEKLAEAYAESIRGGSGSAPSAYSGQPEKPFFSTGKPELNLFVVFEKEFGRPLSPMECETIVGWLDKDRYSDELIVAALKESVFAGKVHFRYIDRILLEWSRNRVKTPEEAKEFTVRYRGGS